MGVQFSLPTMSAMVYDPQRNLFYMDTTDGDLYAFNPVANSLTKILHINGTLTGMDISPNGDFLLIGDSKTTSTPNGDVGTDILHKVALSGMKLTDLTFKTSWGYE